MSAPGLSVAQLIAVVRDDIPSNQIGDVIARIPPRYFDKELGLYRPVAAAVAVAISYSGDCCADCDAALADDVELVANDPTPDPNAWLLVAGQPFEVGRMLQNIGQRMARLYATPKRTTKKHTPVA